MALASSSTASVAYAEEVTYGVIPGTQPKSLRVIEEDMKHELSSASTKEINSTRQTSDSVIVDASTGGGFNMELSYHEYDPFLEAIMTGAFNTFGTGGVKSMTVTINKAAGTITDDGTDGFTGLAVGQWFTIANSAGGNDGVYRVAANTNDVITVDTDTPLSSDETSESLDISSTRLSIAQNTTLRSFSLEKKFADVSQYFIFTGMAPSTMSLDFATGSIVTGSISFLGKESTRAGSTQFPGGSPSASQSYGVMNSVTGVGLKGGKIILRDASSNDILANTYVQSLKISIDAALRGQKAIGVLGNAGVSFGTYKVTGTLEVYLADGAVYDEALANRNVSLSFPIRDVAGNGYGFTYANCKLDVPTIVAGGMDQDVVMSIPFTAIAPDTSTDKVLVVDRFGAAIA